MNALLPPSLPSWRILPIGLIIDGLAGYLFGRLVRVNPVMTTTIFVIRGIAHTLLYHLASYFIKGDKSTSHKIFICTSAAVNMTFIVTLRELNLSTHLISIILSLALFGTLISHVSYLEKLGEKKAETAE